MTVSELNFPFDQNRSKYNKKFDESLLSFDSISSVELSYSDFFEQFLLSNRPCVIRAVSEHWKCQSDWIVNGVPNMTALSFKYGDAEIPTVNCKEKYYNSHTKGSMKLSDYLKYWNLYRDSGYPDTMPSLYLKDWHCFKEYPDEKLYSVPEYFLSDWLNEYYLGFPKLNDDYRFVYMGPKGTWTPLHKDVFSSFSWSVNICGRKEWIFYPPNEASALSDKFGNLAFDVLSDESNPSFPNLSSAKKYTLQQGPGEAVFVPSGWYHQVWNIEDTISINHNWVNGCNIECMLTNLLNENRKVERELEDCRDSTDWSEDCQRLLKATFGLDLEQFLNFILFIVKQRIYSFENCSNLHSSSENTFGMNHIKFDLNSARNVLKILSNLCHPCLDLATICSQLETINSILDFG